MRRLFPGRLVGLAASFAVDADRSYQGLSVPIRRSGHVHSMLENRGRQAKFAKQRKFGDFLKFLGAVPRT
jgi:hypothetical protein